MSNCETYFDVETWYEDKDKTIALVVLKGLGQKVRNRKADITYQIVSGWGRFELAFEAGAGECVGLTRDVQTGESITIPRGTVYQDAGDLVMLAISEPPFDPKAVEIIK